MKIQRFLTYLREENDDISTAVERMKKYITPESDPKVIKGALDSLASHHGTVTAMVNNVARNARKDPDGSVGFPLKFDDPKHAKSHEKLKKLSMSVHDAWDHVIDTAEEAGHFDIDGALHNIAPKGSDGKTVRNYFDPDEWRNTPGRGAGPHARSFAMAAHNIPESERNRRLKLEAAIAKHISLLIEANEDWTDYPKGAKENRKLTPEEEAHYKANVNLDQLGTFHGRITGRRGTPQSPPTLGDVRAIAAKAKPGSTEHANQLHAFVNRFEGLGDKITLVPDSHVGTEYPVVKYMIQARDIAKHYLDKHQREMGKRAADFSFDMESQMAHTGQQIYHKMTPISHEALPPGTPGRKSWKIQVNSYQPDLDDAFKTVLKEEVLCLRENASEMELSKIMMYDRQKLENRLHNMAKAYHAINRHLQASAAMPRITGGDDKKGMMQALFGSSEKTADGLRNRKDAQGRPHILSPVPTHRFSSEVSPGTRSNMPISTTVPVSDVEKMRERAHGHITNLINKISSVDPTKNRAELIDMVHGMNSHRDSFPKWRSRNSLDNLVGSDEEHQGLLHGARQRFGSVNIHPILTTPEIADALYRAPIRISGTINRGKKKS